MTALPRLKPDPIPPIHPVPEYAATGALAAVYDRTKSGLGVPWMGVVAMAFARHPRFYATLWQGLEPVVASRAFAEACADLRACAEAQTTALPGTDLRPHLTGLGYDAREIDEIRACNEVFSHGNMPYLLMASLARALLERMDWTGQGTLTPAPKRGGVPRPVLIEPHHADPATTALYDDIRTTLGLPFVNTDYRAFARWPSYFAPAWADLKRAIDDPGYEACLTRVHNRAVALALALPNPTGLTPQMLRDAAVADGSPDETTEVVRLFQWLLPGLVVNVALLRAQLEARATA